MSDRTQGSVRTDGNASDEDPQTAAIPAEEPAAGKSAAKPAAGAAPGWGGATPSGRQAPATSQAPAARPAGQPPAGPTQPAAAKPAAGKSAGGKQAPAKQAPPKQASASQGQQATVGARAAAPQTGARPANRDAAGAPRQGAGRQGGAAVRPAEVSGRPTGEGDRPGGVRAVRGSGGKGPRRARLQLRHIDTWSALKISLVLAIALFFVWMVAVGVLYGVLNGLGVFTTLNDLIGQLGSSSGDSGGSDVITPGIVFGGAAVIGAVNIVLFTALCTVGTFIYNLCADLVGGLEVTLSERD
ncbi:DUF3566 domain-containing protein [Klenkia marina]|nr:DUF3566 domain-containing protein [Klenkia marina]